MVLARSLLHQSKIVIRIGPSVSVPVDDEAGDPHVMGLLNLLAEHSRILARIADIHVAVIPEPWHINGENLRGGRWSLGVLLHSATYAGSGAATRDHKTRHRET